MPPKKKAKSKAQQYRMCDCPLCHFRTKPIAIKTWWRHQETMQQEQTAIAQHHAGEPLQHASVSNQMSAPPEMLDTSELGSSDEHSDKDSELTGTALEDVQLTPVDTNANDDDMDMDMGSPRLESQPQSEFSDVPPLHDDMSLPPENPGGTRTTGLSLSLSRVPQPSTAAQPLVPTNTATSGSQNAALTNEMANASATGNSDNFDDDAEPETRINITRDDKQMTDQFIKMLEEASLEKLGLPAEDIFHLRNPSTSPPDISIDLSLKYSLKYYLNTLGSSNETYTDVIATSRELQEELGTDLKFLSHHKVKKKAREISGITTVEHHMCPNGCIAYTGPLATLDSCPTCAQLQALYSTPESARAMHYCRDKTRETQEKFPDPNNPSGPPRPTQLDDYIHGSDYLDRVHDGKIKDTDILLMLSLDGAQLYEHRSSDCWMYMWVVLELGPDHRYKKTHVLPSGFIPGLNKPKNVDSFLFPALYHLAALQKEGLKIYDASMKESYIARPLVYFATADAPGMVYLSGLVGHSGACGCCNYCEVPWRHKFTGSHYYPVLHLPNNYHSNHTQPFPDIDLNQHEPYFDPDTYNNNLIRILESGNDFETIRKETGISKVSLFSGLEMPLGVPGAYPLDIMHLIALNVPSVLLDTWRGTM
ncbi:hypothetical protein NP233_g12285 [Leucocoprinus birnbaumii]|uniref:Uncharacterized protein n=1 Tax=Leucocoprinus birnbaumii TaxID=56174 RepID=A0AAD5VFZ0_9AGAR|nr:hypothetical protein NP233_g12285 [Leucocoprinus birnbaumii]